MRYLADLERHVAAEISCHSFNLKERTREAVTVQVENNYYWSATQRFSVTASAHDVLDVLWSRNWLRDEEQWTLLKWIDDDTGIGIEHFPVARFAKLDRKRLVARRSLGPGQLLWIGASDPTGLDLEREYLPQDTMFYSIRSERDGQCSVLFRWCINPEMFPIVLPDNIRTKFLTLEASTRNLRLTRLAEEAGIGRSLGCHSDLNSKATASRSIQALFEPVFDQVVVTHPRQDARVELNQLGWEILLMSLRLEEESERKCRQSALSASGSDSDSDPHRQASQKRSREHLEPERGGVAAQQASRDFTLQQASRDITLQAEGSRDAAFASIGPWCYTSAPKKHQVTPPRAVTSPDCQQHPDPPRDWQDEFWKHEQEREQQWEFRDWSRGRAVHQGGGDHYHQQQRESWEASRGGPESLRSPEPPDTGHVTIHPTPSRDPILPRDLRLWSPKDERFPLQARSLLPPIVDSPHLNFHPNVQPILPCPSPPKSAPFADSSPLAQNWEPPPLRRCARSDAAFDPSGYAQTAQADQLGSPRFQRAPSPPRPPPPYHHWDPFHPSTSTDPALQNNPHHSSSNIFPLNPSRDPLNPSRDPLNPSRDPLNPSRDPLNPSRDPLNPSRDPPFSSHPPFLLGQSRTQSRDLPDLSCEPPFVLGQSRIQSRDLPDLSCEPPFVLGQSRTQSRDLPDPSCKPPFVLGQSRTQSRDLPDLSCEPPFVLGQSRTQSRDLPELFKPVTTTAPTKFHDVSSLPPIHHFSPAQPRPTPTSSPTAPPCNSRLSTLSPPFTPVSLSPPTLTITPSRHDQFNHLPPPAKLVSSPPDQSRDAFWQQQMPCPFILPAVSACSAGNFRPSVPVGHPIPPALSVPAVHPHATADSHPSLAPTTTLGPWNPLSTGNDSSQTSSGASLPIQQSANLSARAASAASDGLGVVESEGLVIPRLATSAIPTLAVQPGGAVPMGVLVDPTEYFRVLAEMQQLLQQNQWNSRKRRGRPRYNPVVIKPKIMKIAPATGSTEPTEGSPDTDEPPPAVQEPN